MKKLIFLICITALTSSLMVLPSSADTVVYNTKTKKIHSPYCQWAKKCTVNCIRIERKQAVKKGGIPCKVCGGS